MLREDLLFYFSADKFDPQKMVKLLDNPGTNGKLLLNAGAKPYLMLRKSAVNKKQLLKQILKILLVQ